MKNKINAIMKDFREAIKAVEAKHGVTIGNGGITYSDTEFTTKLTVKLQESGGRPVEVIEFERVCHLFGFEKEHYGKIARIGGESYALVGFNLRAPKFPLILEKQSDGRRYKFMDTAKRHFLKVATS